MTDGRLKVFEGSIVDKIITAAIIGLLGWNLMTTQRLAVDVAVLNNTIVTVLSDRYTGTQATSRANEVDRRLDRLEQWNQNLSSRVANIENDLRKTP